MEKTKILLADSDRDMLMSYGRLLEFEGYDVTAVFDGFQAVEKLRAKRFDLAIVSRRIPRVACSDIVKLLNESETPSIVLLDRVITPDILLESTAACSYMSFPFFPHELLFRVKNILHRSKNEKQLNAYGLVIDISKFSSEDGTRFTNEEIDVIEAVLQNETIDLHGKSSYINAVNNKLERLGKANRIKYVPEKGYRLVKNNE